MNRWEIEKKVVLKALKDPSFKKKLLSNPKEALKEFCNEKQLGNIQIKIHEEKQGEWIFSIPNINEKQRELTDAELEKLFAACGNMSGGGCSGFSI